MENLIIDPEDTKWQPKAPSVDNEVDSGEGLVTVTDRVYWLMMCDSNGRKIFSIIGYKILNIAPCAPYSRSLLFTLYVVVCIC